MTKKKINAKKMFILKLIKKEDILLIDNIIKKIEE